MDEKIITGYCRCLDQSRMVTAERDGSDWDIDCDFGCCPHEPNCAIAQQLRELTADQP